MDCLASGRPFLLYAPKEMAQSRFLCKTKSGAVLCEERKDLGNCLTFMTSLPLKSNQFIVAKRSMKDLLFSLQ
jgi:hypothetical protein